MAQIDHNKWMEQPRMLNERCRGLPLVWTPDVKWFNNDWLGPTPHVHDDATEIGFMAQGSLEIQIGGSKRVYKKGDFVIMPPNKYHNYWFAGDETACFFVVVAPNHKHNRLRHKDFTPDNYEGDAPHANIYESDELPSNEHFKAEKLTLQPGESTSEQKLAVQDRVLYVVTGAAQVRSNKLSGELVANEYILIPATTPHQISNMGSEPVIVLSLIVTDPFSARAVLEHDE